MVCISCLQLLSPGRYEAERRPDWNEILAYFRGSELQNYFTKIVEDNLKVRFQARESLIFLLNCEAITKPQYVDQIPRAVQGQVEKVMAVRNERNNLVEVCEELDLNVVLGRQVAELSGMQCL